MALDPNIFEDEWLRRFAEQRAGLPVQRERLNESGFVDWDHDLLANYLEELLLWSSDWQLPVPYSCNNHQVWPSVGHGHSSEWERDYKEGCNALLDHVARVARSQRPNGGRFLIQGDGATWADDGRYLATWTYVDLDEW